MDGLGGALLLCLSVVLTSLTTGCATGDYSTASRPRYLAQAACGNSVTCCIQKFPTTAKQSCGVSAAEIAEVSNGARSAARVEALRVAEAEVREQQDAEASEAEAAPEPPDCKGQNHHIISRRIAKRLANHDTLSGQYEPRDERFVAKAKDEESHCGYQKWHLDVDDEVIAWLENNPSATPKQFEKHLRDIYNRPELRQRFPNGF